jgi:hypothetical protein
VPERFRAVAPSAVLVKGLSPDSSYREWGGMIQKRHPDLKRIDLIYLKYGLQNGSRLRRLAGRA